MCSFLSDCQLSSLTQFHTSNFGNLFLCTRSTLSRATQIQISINLFSPTFFSSRHCFSNDKCVKISNIGKTITNKHRTELCEQSVKRIVRIDRTVCPPNSSVAVFSLSNKQSKQHKIKDKYGFRFLYL